jgi:Uma2 family endonuclease
VLKSSGQAHKKSILNIIYLPINPPCLSYSPRTVHQIVIRRTSENINIVQPDMMIICDLEEKLNEDDYYKGVPSLVVEVLSKSTRRKDLIKKLDLYMSCGVSEYWIVNPDNQEVTVYLFEDYNISNSATYKNSEAAQSFIFTGLSAEIRRIFRVKA